MGDVVDRRGDVVDRDDVDLAALDPDRRQPGGQHAARALQQLEEVVGPVDLVDRAGARVADDDPRPVDAPGPGALFADHPLGLVLGAEVGVDVEVFGLVEHVLAPLAAVEPGGGDRADLVEAAGLDRGRELDRVTGPLDVGDLLRFGAGGHVVDRRQVEEVVDVAAQRRPGPPRRPRGRAGRGRRRSGRCGPRRLPSAVRSSSSRPREPDPHERVDGALALQQPLDEVAADEAGRSGDEVVHRQGILPCSRLIARFIHSKQEWRKRPPCRSRCPRWASR